MEGLFPNAWGGDKTFIVHVVSCIVINNTCLKFS